MQLGNKTVARFKTFWELLKETGDEFVEDHVTKLSASLAYYTLFSIGPLMLVIIHIIGVFYKKQEAATSVVFKQVSQFIGTKGAAQLEGMLDKMNTSNNSTLFGVIGILVFVFSATSIFTEMQSSMNYMWSIKARPKRGWLKYIKDRLLSLLLIVGLGLLLVASLVLNLVIDAVVGQLNRLGHLQQYLGDHNIALLSGVNTIVFFIIVTLLFAIIFKVLPDAVIKWKDVLVGASFTGLLFLIGKFLISLYLTNSKLITAYGAAASMIILLSWIYYSALILYFGAEFTDVYARKCGSGVVVKKTAVFVISREAKELPTLKTHREEDLHVPHVKDDPI
jgi:membrane protein